MRSHEVIALFTCCYWHQPVDTLNWITSCTVYLFDSRKTAIAETCFTTESDISQSAWKCSLPTVHDLVPTDRGKKPLHSLARNSHATGASTRGTDNWGIPLVSCETTGELRAKIMVWWSHCDHNLDFCFV